MSKISAVHYQDYCLHGVRIRLGWDDESLRLPLQSLASHFGLEASEAEEPQITLTLAVHAPHLTIPASAVEVDWHHGVITRRCAEQLYVSDEHLTITLNPTAGQGVGVYCARPNDMPGVFRMDLIVCCLVLLLRRQGLYALHAACLEHDGVGYVFIADCDNGKSTLAYSLMQQGWRYISDDSIFLRPHDHSVEALAFRKSMLLDPEAAEYFPEITSYWSANRFGDANKQRLNVEAMYPQQAVRAVTPGVLIFPQIAHTEKSRLLAAGKAEAVQHLMRQSLVVTFEPAIASRHLNVFSRLLGQTQCYVLHAGRDVLDDPAQVAAQLAETALAQPDSVFKETRYATPSV